MNKEYWEYYFSKKKKMTERAFKVRIAMLMMSMLACATIMASSAFAFFKSDITSTTNLRAATFEVSGLQTAASGDTRTYELYGTPGVSGYCVITVWDKYGAPTIYYTKPFIGSMNITITAAEGSGISIKPHWGDPRNFGITANLIGNGGVIEHSRTPEPEPEGESGSGGGETSDVSTADPPGKGTVVPDNTPTVDATEDKITEEKFTVASPSTDNTQTEETKTPVVEKTPAPKEENRLTETQSAPPSEKGNETEKQKAESEPVQKTEAPVKVTDIKPATSSGNNDAGSGNGDSSGSSSSDAPAPAVSSAGGESASDSGGE